MPEQQAVAQRPNITVVNPVIRLHEADSVAVTRTTLLPGAPVANGVIATQRIPPGHKAAVRNIEVGEPVRKYNQIIGFATQAIAPGEHGAPPELLSRYRARPRVRGEPDRRTAAGAQAD